MANIIAISHNGTIVLVDLPNPKFRIDPSLLNKKLGFKAIISENPNTNIIIAVLV